MTAFTSLKVFLLIAGFLLFLFGPIYLLLYFGINIGFVGGMIWGILAPPFLLAIVFRVINKMVD